MRIKKFTATALAPVAIAGVAVAGYGITQAATSHQAAQAAVRQVSNVRAVSLPGKPSDALVTGREAHHLVVRAQLAAWHQQSRHAAAVAAAKRAAAARAAARAAAAARQAATAQQPAAQPAAAPSSGSLSGMSAFERCVAWRESGNNPTASSAGLFGILPSTWASLGYPGTAGSSPVSLQMAAFNKLYAMYGTSPWAPYDGC